jgi:hypothetical protein
VNSNSSPRTGGKIDDLNVPCRKRNISVVTINYRDITIRGIYYLAGDKSIPALIKDHESLQSAKLVVLTVALVK